nr:uncharacterized protein LOC105848753 [Hydra vulgaris]
MLHNEVIVVIDRKEQLNIVKEFHEGLGNSEKAVALASHLGINAVRKQIFSRFFLHTIREDITKHVAQCERCQKTSNRNLKVSPALKPVKVEQQVMKQVGVDSIKLPESNGFNYVTVLIDNTIVLIGHNQSCEGNSQEHSFNYYYHYFSKWTEAEPLIDKTAVSVAAFLYRVICRHGCFRKQINDQGRKFLNSVSIALHDMTGVQQRVTSAYHPQANDLVENQNQTIKKAIVKVLTENGKSWASVLDGILFVLRVKVHDSMGYSPFCLMYNRQPYLPIDVKYTNVLNGDNYNPVYDKEVLQKVLQMKRGLEATVVQTY